ncbi:soluble lytic murein transglycosylase-like protein [Burkholderiales bacterium JOSHI_001]|nr:soluble lytic murein transglycosylase-like protein [Burkholderiales bacterium JOSHI_001]
MAVFARDIGHGMLEVSHNSLALLGLAVVAVVLFAASRDDLRESAERQALDWLMQRHEARAVPGGNALVEFSEPDAVARATAADPSELTRQQVLVANWLARRYHVAPQPVSRLVKEAWDVGRVASLDPTLILAMIAIESSFNPFAQSPVGAQGLMQVMTHIHDDKYEAFGGTHAAFDPVTNLRVGVQVLKECIARAGSLEHGLRFYVGAANLDHDGGYASKVLAEQEHLRQVLQGRTIAFNAPLPTPVPLSAPVATPASLAVPAGGALRAPAAASAAAEARATPPAASPANPPAPGPTAAEPEQVAMR